MWPWSKIRALEAEVAHALALTGREERNAEWWREEVKRARDDYRALLDKYTDLKREGFEPPRPLPDAPAAADDLPPAVRAAILRRARPGSDLFAQLAAYARTALGGAEGEEAAAAIARQVEDGQDPADYGV